MQGIKRAYDLRVLFLSVFLLFGIWSAKSQEYTAPTLNVTSREVLIPVMVAHKESNSAGDSWLSDINGLTVSDFKVFEDGLPVSIVGMHSQIWSGWGERDGTGYHCVESDHVGGLWTGVDVAGRIPHWCDANADVYYISIRPHAGANTSCHKVKVKVDIFMATVYSRQEYCDAGSLSDPLSGTSIGEKLQAVANSDVQTKIQLTGQIASFSSEKKSLAQITLEFPSQMFKPYWDGKNYSSTVFVAATIYSGDQFDTTSRFSDPGPWSWINEKYEGILPTTVRLIELQRDLSTDEGYARQIELPPGRYVVKAAITNGVDFGRVELPITVPSPASSGLEISSVVLCKRFHRPEDAQGEERRPSDFIPLVSGGVEFSPTGDIHFRPGDRLIAWFQIRSPHGSPLHSMQLRITVVNTVTGHAEADSGSQTVQPTEDLPAVANGIAKEVKIDKLPPGSYRIMVQATDPQTSATATSSATFVVAS